MPPEEVSGWLGKRVDILVREETKPVLSIGALVLGFNIVRALVFGIMGSGGSQ